MEMVNKLENKWGTIESNMNGTIAQKTKKKDKKETTVTTNTANMINLTVKFFLQVQKVQEAKVLPASVVTTQVTIL